MPKPSLPRPDAATRGFTVIEVLVTLVILGILAGVALPVFNDAIRKSRRSEAISSISAVQQAQERWRSSRPAYSSNLTAAASDDPPGLGLPSTTSNGYYTIALANVGTDGYDVTATAGSNTSQASDSNCAKLGIRVLRGNTSYAGTGPSGTLDYQPANKCWSR